MRRMRFHICSSVLIGICCFLFLEPVLAQKGKRPEPLSNDDNPALQAVLKELRQLRLAIENANSIAYRAQITIERMKFQQSRVDRLTQQLEETQDNLDGVNVARQQLAEHIKDLETQIRGEQDSDRRQQYETELKDSRISLDQQVKREVQTQERLVQLKAQLQFEQSKLDELNDRLKTLESDMETRQRSNKQ